MANANGNMLLAPSCTTVINSVPLYLPYSHVPSIFTMSLQNANASIHALNDQKSQWNMTLFVIDWFNSSSAWIVWILTIMLRTKSCKACRYLGSMLYDSSQLPYTCSRAHWFSSHALRYVMMYPNSCLTNAMNVGKVSCSFSSTIARIFLPTSFESILLWSCEMVGMTHVWGPSIILISQTFRFFLSDTLSLHWHTSVGQHKTHVSFTHLLCLKVTWFLTCDIFTTCLRSSNWQNQWPTYNSSFCESDYCCWSKKCLQSGLSATWLSPTSTLFGYGW